MEHPELSVNKLLLVVLIIFFRCGIEEQPYMIYEKDKSLNLFAKQVTFNNKIFSGSIYNTNSSNDTISLGKYKNGYKHGEWKKFYSNGALKEKRFYKNGLKEGVYNGFYKDGSKNFVFIFENGEYNGTNRIWAYGGQIIEELNFKKGQQYGSQKVWYLDGKVKSNYIVKNKRRYGLLGTKNCTNVSEEVFNL